MTNEESLPSPSSLLPEQSTPTSTILRRTAAVIGLAGVAMLPIASGAVLGMKVPVSVELAPGVEPDVSLQHSDSATVSAGLIGSIHIPQLHKNVPLLGPVSPRIDFNNEIRVPFESDKPLDLNVYSSLATDYPTTVIQPVRKAIINRGIAGGAAGAAVSAGFAGWYIRRRKQAIADELKRHHQQEAETGLNNSIVELQAADGHPRVIERLQAAQTHLQAARMPGKEQSRTKPVLAAAAATSLVLSGCAINAIPVSNLFAKPPADSMPLAPEIAGLHPLLSNVTISGTGAELIQMGLKKAKLEADEINRFWELARVNTKIEIGKFAEGGGLDYLLRPEIVPILQVSDIHCNQPYTKILFGEITHSLGARIVINTGDTYVTDDTMPYEANCLKDVIKELDPMKQGGQVIMVNAMGNHDPAKAPKEIADITYSLPDGEPYKPLVSLDEQNNYQATIHGITFVGDADPTRSTKNESTAAARKEQHSMINEQGNTIAKIACEVAAEDNTPPIIIGHHPESTLAAVAEGCTMEAASGHTHASSEIRKYLAPNGQYVLQQTLGSSSGAPADSKGAISITQYAKPYSPATARLRLYNTQSDRIEAYIDIVVQRDGSVAVSRPEIPMQAELVTTSTELKDYLPSYPGLPGASGSVTE